MSANAKLSGISGELLDHIAEAIRSNGARSTDKPFADLPDDYKKPWLDDADLAMAALFAARPDVKVLLVPDEKAA